MVLTPTSFLQDYISYEEINDHEVKVSITYKGVTASGVFHFNDEYEMTLFTTNDRGNVDTKGNLEYIPWSAVCGDYQVNQDNIKALTIFKAVWNYEDGDLVYFDGKIEKITYTFE